MPWPEEGDCGLQHRGGQKGKWGTAQAEKWSGNLQARRDQWPVRQQWLQVRVLRDLAWDQF